MIRMEEYFASDKEDAPDNIPMMYISFPSAKDPTSRTRFPGFSYVLCSILQSFIQSGQQLKIICLNLFVFLGQSRMVIHTMVNLKWFGQWNNISETERDEEYEKYKMRFANHLFDWACVHFPKLKEKVN